MVTTNYLNNLNLDEEEEDNNNNNNNNNDNNIFEVILNSGLAVASDLIICTRPIMNGCPSSLIITKLTNDLGVIDDLDDGNKEKKKKKKNNNNNFDVIFISGLAVASDSSICTRPIMNGCP